MSTTRAEARIQAHMVKISKARCRYKNSHDALLWLGTLDSDWAGYLVLTSSDLKPLQAHLEEDSWGVGQGYTLISWIWQSSAALNVSEWQVNGQHILFSLFGYPRLILNKFSALRTEWFRSRECFKCWEEQLVLLKREMVMVIRTFLKCKEIWQWKARSGDPTPGIRVYALRQGQFYEELAHRMMIACKDHSNGSCIMF